MHDKAMYPILSLFDGHHVRVSVLLKRSKKLHLVGMNILDIGLDPNHITSQTSHLENSQARCGRGQSSTLISLEE